MQRSKLRPKLRGSIGVPCRVVKIRPVSIQQSRTVTVSVLQLADLECSHAQLGQRPRCLRCFGLDLSADELTPDSPELLANV